jgi:hypothetical protein
MGSLLPHTYAGVLLHDEHPSTTALVHYVKSFPPRCCGGVVTDESQEYNILLEIVVVYHIHPTHALVIGDALWTSYLDKLDVVTHPTLPDTGEYDFIVSSASYVQSRQAIGGSCVIILDNPCESEEIIFKYTSSYKQVYLYKPEADNPSSSRIFLIALQYFRKIDTTLNYKRSKYFTSKVVEIITIMGQSQLEYLRYLDVPKGKSVEWKSKYIVQVFTPKKNMYPLLTNGPTNRL